MNKNKEVKQAFLKDNFARLSPKTRRTYNISLNQFFSFCQQNGVDTNEQE